MSKLFNIALQSAKMLNTVESTVLKTDHQIMYRIPRVFKCEQEKLQVFFEEDYVVLIENKGLEIEKICPVAESPLDSYRGRGLHSRKKC